MNGSWKHSGNRISKYKAVKTEVDGIKFDSKKESNRYLELKEMEQKGFIKYLQMQVPYIIIPKSQYGRKIVYKADFVYFDSQKGTVIVEDVKSPYTRKNPVYRLKKRLMAEVHGIIIKEV